MSAGRRAPTASCGPVGAGSGPVMPFTPRASAARAQGAQVRGLPSQRSVPAVRRPQPPPQPQQRWKGVGGEKQHFGPLQTHAPLAAHALRQEWQRPALIAPEEW